ncbi:MAG: carbonic anhydrase [Archangium sp.]|nr:carbonic anhydrase [Archangium sp.]
MHRLLRSLVDFRTELAPRLKPLFKALAQSQNPELLLVTCCDSRVMPHLFTGDEPGGVFTVRTVGNVVAPAGAGHLSTGDVSEAAAIEYAVDVLGIRDIAVCGHSNCGAMKAVADGRQGLVERAPNLVEWLAHAEPAVERLKHSPFIDSALPQTDRLSQANVLVQLEHIASYPLVRGRQRAGELKLHALWFDIEHTLVSMFEANRGRFVVLDEAEVTRLLAPAGDATQ